MTLSQAPVLRPQAEWKLQNVLERVAEQRRRNEGFPPPPPKAPPQQQSPFITTPPELPEGESIDEKESSTLQNQETARIRAGSPVVVRHPPNNLVSPDFPRGFKQSGNLFVRGATGVTTTAAAEDIALEDSAGCHAMAPIAEDDEEQDDTDALATTLAATNLQAAPRTPPWHPEDTASAPGQAGHSPRGTASSATHSGPTDAPRIPIKVEALGIRSGEIDGLQTVKKVYPPPKSPPIPFNVSSSMQHNLTGRGKVLLLTEDAATETQKPMMAETASGPPTASGAQDLSLSHTSGSTASEVVTMDVDAPAQAATAPGTGGTPAASDPTDVPPKLVPYLSNWRDQHITLIVHAADLEQLEIQVEQKRGLHENNQDLLNNAEKQAHAEIGEERYINDHLNPLKLNLADSGAQLDTYIEIRDQVQSKHDETVMRYQKLNEGFTNLTPELSTDERQLLIDKNVKLAANSNDEDTHNMLLQEELEQRDQHYMKLVQSAVNNATSQLRTTLEQARVKRIYSAAMQNVLKDLSDKQEAEVAAKALSHEELLRRVIAEASPQFGGDSTLTMKCNELMTQQKAREPEAATASAAASSASGPQAASTVATDMAAKDEPLAETPQEQVKAEAYTEPADEQAAPQAPAYEVSLDEVEDDEMPDATTLSGVTPKTELDVSTSSPQTARASAGIAAEATGSTPAASDQIHDLPAQIDIMSVMHVARALQSTGKYG